MNKLNTARRSQIVAALVEGNSINATVRMTGAAKHTVLKLLASLGKPVQPTKTEPLEICLVSVFNVMRFGPSATPRKRMSLKIMKGQFGFGDVWTWTALCADTRLVPCWLIGERNAEYAAKFIDDLASRLAHRVQLTTDGHRPYLEAVWDAFGNDIDYAMLVKLYSNPPTGAQARYSPGECCGAKKKKITGNPERKNVSTSFIERQNLTMRMSMRRFTRLTNAFSKKVENLEHAVAVHFMYYNFGRVHQTLRVTPAMEAGVANHVWELKEIVGLLN
jgi:IS1 family transposase